MRSSRHVLALRLRRQVASLNAQNNAAVRFFDLIDQQHVPKTSLLKFDVHPAEAVYCDGRETTLRALARQRGLTGWVVLVSRSGPEASCG